MAVLVPVKRKELLSALSNCYKKREENIDKRLQKDLKDFNDFPEYAAEFGMPTKEDIVELFEKLNKNKLFIDTIRLFDLLLGAMELHDEIDVDIDTYTTICYWKD